MCFCLSGWPTDRPSEVSLVLVNSLSLLGRISSAPLSFPSRSLLDSFPISLNFFNFSIFLVLLDTFHCIVSIFIPLLLSHLPPLFPVTAEVCKAMLSSPTVILQPYGLPVYPQTASCYPGLVQVMCPFSCASCLYILFFRYKYDAFEYTGFIHQHC